MKLTHPQSDQVIDVDESTVDQYLSQGWAPVVESPAEKKK